VSKVFKGLLIFALGLVVLWWVAVHSGPREGTVIVHGMENDVEVDIAGRTYSFGDSAAGPLVLRLPAGRYEFRVRRGEKVLHAETVLLRGGGSEVLAAIRDDPGVLAPQPRGLTAGESSGQRGQERPCGRSTDDLSQAGDRYDAP
jgi:hypothetical protein